MGYRNTECVIKLFASLLCLIIIAWFGLTSKLELLMYVRAVHIVALLTRLASLLLQRLSWEDKGANCSMLNNQHYE